MAEVIQTSSGSFTSEGLIGIQIENHWATLFARIVGIPLILFGLMMFGVGIYFVFKEYIPDIGDAVGFWPTVGSIFLALLAAVMFLGFAAVLASVGVDLLTLKRPDAASVVIICLLIFAGAIGSWTPPMQDDTGGVGGILMLLYGISIAGSYYLVTLRNVRLQYVGTEMVAKNLHESEAKSLVSFHGPAIGLTPIPASE